MGLWLYTQQSSPRTKDHRASPQTIIHPSTLYQPGFSSPMHWKHTPYMEALPALRACSIPGQLLFTVLGPGHVHEESGAHACLTELIHGSHHDITGAHHLRSTFRGFIHLANFGHGSDTTCKDSGHHISPQWYDIVHFGPKPSWICFWALPQKASYQWRYLSILIYP